jgi:hypothetical protein
MQLVVLLDTEKEAWTNLVKKYNGNVFSYAAYLDATAENWAVLYNDNKTAGIACPFTIKAGQKVLYSPFFNRYVEWIGAEIDLNILLVELKKHFKVADFNFLQPVDGFELLQHHYLESNEIHLNSLAKRSLKKALVFTTDIQTNAPQLMPLIANELATRVKSLNAFTLPKLSNLVASFKDNGLLQIDLLEENSWCGGLWLIESNEKVLYLKGTVQQEAMKKGGMYRLIFDAINYAHSVGKSFDFGGSNVENVARFNANFGAKSIKYARITWNNAPFWWKILKKLNNRWKEK